MYNMEEVEIKILEINPRKIRNLILENEGKRVKKVFQKNVYYENMITRREGIVVRVRQENHNFWLTIKSSMSVKNGHKVRKEYELRVVSFEFADEMISLLGLKKVGVHECKREYFRLNDCMVEIIEMPKIPAFIEIEGTERNILKVARMLGYSEKDYVTGYVLDIYNVKTSVLKF